MYTKKQEFVAELLGTLFILLFGAGVNAMVVLFNLGSYGVITIGWGIGVFLGILVSVRISGAHLNPAVTLSLVVIKRFPAKKMLHYIPAQMLGGFLGAALVYAFYASKFDLVDPHHFHTAGIFTTFPAVPQYWKGFMAELIATAVLMFTILAIIEYYVQEKSGWCAPLIIGVLIVGIGMSLGGMHGYAMNPARDLSPRIFVALMGFQNNGLTQGSWIWTQAVFGSLVGGPLGALIYEYTIGVKSR